MKRRHAFLLLILLGGPTAWVPCLARAEDPAARKELEAIYDQYVQSYLAKDVGPLHLWFEQHLAPEALEISTLNQRQDRAGILDETRQARALWPLAKESTGRILQIEMQGTDAIVWFTHRVVREVPDPRNTPDSPHPPHQLVTLSSGRDTWVKQAEGWKCPLSVNVAMQATLDGKPVSVPGTTPTLPVLTGAKPGGAKLEKSRTDSKPPQ